MTMYPLGPYDDFPEGFCAIREDSGELRFYIPAGESANHKLFCIKSENAKLRELAENLLMAFVVLETPKEQQKCIDHAMELRRELNVLPMETFDARKFGIEAD